MSENDFGFPLVYSQLSHYYDVLNSDDYDKKNHIIETVLKENNIKTVLDFTCGTGSQVFYLANYGYHITGVDINKVLLDIAKSKAGEKSNNITLSEGDICSSNAGRFDAVISIFNAIGHLNKPNFEKALENIHHNLNSSGLYIFDIFNLDAMTDTVIKDLRMDIKKTINNTVIHNKQYSTLNRKTGQLTSYDQFSIKEASKDPRQYSGQFSLQLYTATELSALLKKHHFEIINQSDFETGHFDQDKSLRILTIAKKINTS